ncbi:MAG: SpoIID/LytB domain-containing protein, partial [Bacteroidota bacterium]
MRRIILLWCLLFTGMVLPARSLKVGLFVSKPTRSIQFSSGKSPCHFYHKGSKVFDLPGGSTVFLEEFGGTIRLMQDGATRGLFSDLTIRPVIKSSAFSIRPGDKSEDFLPFNGSLTVKSKQGGLQLVNEVGMEEYVSAVVESEIGLTSHPEMLKVQAILIRTYALANQHRHQAQGFSLCDGVHCQAYYGQSRFNPSVQKAVSATKGQVVIDSEGKLVLSVYHSNCGGKTAYAGDAWSKDIPVLQPVIDSFCIASTHALWEKRMTSREWGRTLMRLGISDTSSIREQLTGLTDRVGFIGDGDTLIPVKLLRKELDLRSSFFSIEMEGDTVILEGRGYGHGVGLCQEGAIAMAQQGFKAK